MIIVKKFGGTSLRDKESRLRVIEKIKKDLNEDNKILVVVSAMGRYPENFATDTLINMANENILNQEYKKELSYKKNLDLIMSQGENISSIIIAMMLESIGISSKALNANMLGIITDENFGDANIIRLKSKKLKETIDKNIIPVITGFQGLTRENDITTLGRGGSDLTAVVIAHMAKADLIEIYTDVDGVMEEDPKKNKDAKMFKTLSYKKLIEMSKAGAKVMHSKAAECGMKTGIDLVIKNTFSESAGTLITKDSIDEIIV